MRLHFNKKYVLLIASILVTAVVYWPGLSGAYIFDDFPNIVDNSGVQPKDAGIPSLARAALSSPSSEFSRPLASLSFAANYLATGLDPYWMKLTNLVIHLLNGLLVFVLARLLLRTAGSTATKEFASKASPSGSQLDVTTSTIRRIDTVAILIATGWMLLPINLTAVLYVVQRMESIANLFVMLGLIGYVAGRRQMLTYPHLSPEVLSSNPKNRLARLRSLLEQGFLLCLISLTVPTFLGALAKETAVMLPMYALMTEWALFRFRATGVGNVSNQLQISRAHANQPRKYYDWRVFILFLFSLLLPVIGGLAWILPRVLNPHVWITRTFNLSTRLLSEPRAIVDYIVWTFLPTPHALSFYHDDFRVSLGLTTPWTTLASIMSIVGLIVVACRLRQHRPLVALGITLFFSCHLLTGTILPLELIYEHRNYFASFGLLLAVIPLLAAPSTPAAVATSTSTDESRATNDPVMVIEQTLPLALARYVLLIGLMLGWTVMTTLTAYAWGNPVRLAEDLAYRAPQSPRAQYELGRTYIIASRYNPNSQFTPLVYAPLERAAALPDSSILPEQALIFMNSRMHRPIKDAWWNSLIAKLNSRAPTVQDESSLASLTQCAREHDCDLSSNRLNDAFTAALSHPNPSGRLLANYGDFAWNLLDDKLLGVRMSRLAVQADPKEPVYRITLIRMLLVEGQYDEAHEAFKQLQALNYGGRLNANLEELKALPGMQ